jgi:DNA-binding GntR family transcriptional regulator
MLERPSPFGAAELRHCKEKGVRSQHETVGPTSAAATVANVLRERILHGELVGGERVPQDAVATQLNVSQMIVREAFKQLVMEGFLRAEPRRGVRVTSLSIDEVAEMTELRSLIEAKALEWAIPRMSKSDLERAGRILTDLDKARSTDRVIHLNAQFHESLYAPSGKARTLSMITTLRMNFERYLRYTWEETPHLNQSQKEHREILELCIAKDAKRACALLKQHISGTGSLLMERLKSTEVK